MTKSLDYRDELEQWMDLWNQAEKNDLIPKESKLTPQAADLSDYYYDNLDRMAEEEGMLQESEDVVNPIMTGSKGKDSDPEVPWIDNDSIEEVAELKRQLYEIECQLITKEAGGKKWNEKPILAKNEAISDKIESIKKKIDKLSDKLGLGEKDYL